MNEYISVPSYFDVDMVECHIVSEFLRNAVYISERKINLDCLRSIYSLDEEKGLRLIDELKLRGFKFIQESSSTLLRTVEPNEEIEIIYTAEDTGKHSKINRSIFDYNNQMKTDFYFNLIPIYAFQNIIKDFNYDLIKQEFLRYGYEVLSKEAIQGKPEKAKKETRKTIRIPNYTRDADIIEIIKKIINMNLSLKEEIENIGVQDILPKSTPKERLLSRKLEKDKIDTVRDLIKYDMSNLEQLSKVGEASINEFKVSVIKGIKNLSQVERDLIANLSGPSLREYIESLIEENETIEYVYKTTKIEDILPNVTNAEKGLIKRLEGIKMIRVYDLLKYDISVLKETRGIGEKGFKNILETIKFGIDKISDQEELRMEEKKELSEEVFYFEDKKFHKIKDYTVVEINDLINEGQILIGEDLASKQIKDLQNIQNKYFKKQADIIVLNNLKRDIESLFDLNHVIKQSIPKKLSDRDQNIIYERTILGRTLEEVGQEVGVTRERIRQIERTVLKKYNAGFKRNKFIKSCQLNFSNKTYFHIDDLKDLLTEDNYFIIGMIITGTIDHLYYFEPLDRVYLKSFDQMTVDIEELIKTIPDYGDLEEDIESIIEPMAHIIEDITYEESIKVLESYGISVARTYYLKNKNNEKQRLEIIYKYVQTVPLTLDDEGAKTLSNYFCSIFNIDIESNPRNWDGKTSRISEMILVAPKTYIHLDHIPIKQNMLQKTKEIIDRELLDHTYIYAEKLLDEINLEYPNNNIISKHHIYFIAKYYFAEFYEASKGNSLRFSKKGEPSVTNSQLVYNVCLEHNGIASFEIISKATNWAAHRIEMAIANSHKLIKLGASHCAVLDRLFQGEEKEIFKKIVLDDMKAGYTTTNKIYYKLLFDETMSAFIDRNKINDGKEISALIKWLDDKILGHNIFLYYENQDIRNISDVIFSRYPEKVYRSEMLDILEEFKMISNQLHSYINNLLLDKKYVQISREEYLNYDLFKFDDALIEELLIYFDEINLEDGFVVPQNHLSDVTRNFRGNEHGWNQYTIATILTQNGYKQLTRFNASYTYEILVLVKEDSDYNDISYLMYGLLKNQYHGRLHELQVYDFLSTKGLYKVETHNYNKKLQVDAKENKLISVDIVGNIKLKE